MKMKVGKLKVSKTTAILFSLLMGLALLTKGIRFVKAEEVGTFNEARYKEKHGEVFQTINYTAFVPEGSMTPQLSANSEGKTIVDGKVGHIVTRVVEVHYGLEPFEGQLSEKTMKEIQEEKIEQDLEKNYVADVANKPSIYGDDEFKSQYYDEVPSFRTETMYNGSQELIKRNTTRLSDGKTRKSNSLTYTGVTLSPAQLAVAHTWMEGHTLLSVNDADNTFKFSDDENSEMPISISQGIVPLKVDENLDDGLQVDLRVEGSDDPRLKLYNGTLTQSAHELNHAIKHKDKNEQIVGIQFYDKSSVKKTNTKNIGRADFACAGACVGAIILGIAAAGVITGLVVDKIATEQRHKKEIQDMHDQANETKEAFQDALDDMQEQYEDAINRTKQLLLDKANQAYENGYLEGSADMKEQAKSVVYNYHKNGSMSAEMYARICSALDDKNEQLIDNVTVPYSMDDVNEWYEERGIKDHLEMPGGANWDDNGFNLWSNIEMVVQAVIIVTIAVVVIGVIIFIIGQMRKKDED